MTPSNDDEILRQCLVLAARGSLFKGIFYEQANFESATGVNTAQIECLLRYWPQLNSPELLAEYSALERQKPGYGESCPYGPAGSGLPVQAKIYSAVDTHLYFVICEIGFQLDQIRRALANASWKQYIGIGSKEVVSAVGRWRVRHRHAIVEAIEAAEAEAKAKSEARGEGGAQEAGPWTRG